MMILIVDLGVITLVFFKPGEFNMFNGLCDFGTVDLVQIGISLKGVS